jgi:hypothetical protein
VNWSTFHEGVLIAVYEGDGLAAALSGAAGLVLVIIAVGAELPSAMRQRAVLNDEIGRGAGRYLDRKAHRRISVRNVPIPDRLDEVGDSGGGPDAPRKAIGSDVFAAAIGWLKLHLRKTDRLRKAPCCGKSRKKLKPNAMPHLALGYLEVFRGFSSSPLLPLKHFATRQSHARPDRPENPQKSLGKTPSPDRRRRDITWIHSIVIASLIDVHQSFAPMSELSKADIH